MVITNKEYHKNYYQTNKELYKIRSKIYRDKNKETLKEKDKRYYELNKEQLKIKHREYNLSHKKQIHIYRKNKLNTDINLRLSYNLRRRLLLAIERNWKSGSTLDLLGCSIDALKQHLENQFKEGMTWNNYGKWHIDHIRPCCSFDLSKEKEQKECFHYSNLQPLWASENLSKGGKIL